ncbi:hypothetical protein ACFFMN_33870 [Planobispora siamensis]|uniref:Uncharacterized protein n=1 Tax=Planobispora siamensis TaxID=936338 RepID=A0A8J3SGB7_9ACTN|nr:hypothetical protein [Planobispora siamensis]GIH91960.1 hypothetical protein Psi01_25900 [Planobispora siamensis]
MRIQVLNLPSVVVGEDVQEPFALIVDQAGTAAEVDHNLARLTTFATQIGAQGLFVTQETVEIVDPYADGRAEADDTPVSG